MPTSDHNWILIPFLSFLTNSLHQVSPIIKRRDAGSARGNQRVD